MTGAAAATTAAEGVKHTLRMYRQLLGLAKRLPGEQRTQALAQIREGFRSNAQEDQSEKIKSLLASASSSLSYLRMVTPKRPAPSSETGRTRIVYVEGEAVVDGEGEQRGRAAVSNWTGSNLDPDAVARHSAQLQRMGFRDNAHAKGYF